jgi:hypothetical protein
MADAMTHPPKENDMLRKTVIGTALAALALAAGAAQAHERTTYREDRIAAERHALYDAQARRDADLRRLRFDERIRNFAAVERDRAQLAYDRQQVAAARYAVERDTRGWHRG